MSSKDNVKKRLMYSKSGNKEITFGLNIDEIIEEPFHSFLQRYQKGLENSMKGREVP